MGKYNSITAGGASEPFYLQVARGDVAGHKAVNKFGYNAAVGSSEDTIWVQDGDINWPATASKMKVSSSDDADNGGTATGMLTVTIEGLDANWDLQSETVTLTGTTDTITVGTYIRVFRAYGATFGSGATNAGVIYVYTGADTAGVPDVATTIYTTIGVGDGQTLQAAYSIPRNYTGYLSRFTASSTGNGSVTITTRLKVRPGADSATAGWLTKDMFILKAGSDTIVDRHYDLPKVIAEKSDIQVTGDSSGANVDVTAAFDLIIIKNVPDHQL